MTMNMRPAYTRSTVVGVFHEHSSAEDAISQLRNAGFTDDQIGFLAPDSTRNYDRTTGDRTVVDRTVVTDADPASPGVGGGLVTGAITGGIVAAATALLIPGIGPVLAGGILATALGGAAIGAATGGIVGGLMDMGVSEEEANYYQGEFASGRTLVTVRAGDRYTEAATIMRRCGAYDIENRDIRGDRLAS